MAEVNPSEHSEQTELINWTREEKTRREYPEVEWLFAIPNGAKLPYIGKGRSRYSKQAMILKAEGLKPGVPDLCLPVPAGRFSGLFIELKSLKKGAKVSPEQQEWIFKLRDFGYMTMVCFGFESAKNAIINYLGLKKYKEEGLWPLP